MGKRLFRVVTVISTESEDAAREFAQLIVLRSQLGTSRRDVGLRSWALEELAGDEVRTLSTCAFSPDYKLNSKRAAQPPCTRCGNEAHGGDCQNTG